MHVMWSSGRFVVVGLPASSLVVTYMKNDTRRAAFLLSPLLFTRNERLTYHIAAQIASLRSSSRIWASSPCRILCSLAATATVLDEDDGDEEWSRSRPAASAGDADAAMAAAAAPRAAAPSRRFNPLPIILIYLRWWSCVVWWSGNTPSTLASINSNDPKSELEK